MGTFLTMAGSKVPEIVTEVNHRPSPNLSKSGAGGINVCARAQLELQQSFSIPSIPLHPNSVFLLVGFFWIGSGKAKYDERRPNAKRGWQHDHAFLDACNASTDVTQLP